MTLESQHVATPVQKRTVQSLCTLVNHAANLLVLLMLTGFTAAAQAQFNYMTNNGAITITGYAGAGGDIVIPEVTNGFPVTGIADWAFYDSSSLTSVTIPDTVTNLGRFTFYHCVGLTNVTLPNGLKVIPEYAFYFCSSLTGITIPDTVTTIGDYALSDCASLTNISFPGSVKSIGTSAFASCTSLSSVTIPNGITSISGYSYAYCTSLTNIVLPQTVTGIGAWAFAHCPNLSSITLPQSVTSIGSVAFGYCGLTNITIGTGVALVGDQAFFGCETLSSIAIPSSVVSIGSEAFEQCNNLTSINVDPSNSAYSSTDGVLFDKTQSTLIRCPAGKTGPYSIPTGVNNIAASAFHFCAYLTSVMIPDSIISIGDAAFAYCYSLTNVTTGSGLTSIGNGAFQVCLSLTGVYFRGDTPSLGFAVFWPDDNATVYFLPGSGGWGPTFGDIPTAVWAPTLHTSYGNFDISTNKFAFNVSWTSGKIIVVEACTNLAAPIWSPLETNTLMGESLSFGDMHWTNYPVRFYRLRSL